MYLCRQVCVRIKNAEMKRFYHTSRLSTSFSHLQKKYLPYLKGAYVSQRLQTAFSEWVSQSVSRSRILRALRLTGLTWSGCTVPLIKFYECQQKQKLSRRSDHYSQEKFSEVEPSLAFRDVWALLRPYLGLFVLAVVSAVLTALLNVEIPLRLGELVNVIAGIIREQGAGHAVDVAVVQPVAFKLVTLYVLQAALTFGYITFLSILGERMAADLRVKLFNRLLLLDMAFYDTQKTSELSSRLNVDVQEFKSSFKLTIAQGLRTFAQVGGCLVSLLRLSPRMTALTMAAVPIVILVGSLCGALLRGLSRRAQAQSAVASSVADEAFGNIRTVRAFAMEEQESSLFQREVTRAAAMQEQLGMGIGLFQGGTNLFLNGIVLAVLYGGSQLLTSGEMSPGQLMSFLVTAQTIQKSLSQLSIVFGSALKGWTAGARVFQFANVTPVIRNDDGICIPHHTLWGEIKFEDVCFAYPSRPGHTVFHNLNLTIPAGQVVALCGPSGEGKSTITSLLERFYDPQSGRISLDGRDLRELNTEWLRGRVVGLISQEPVLFHCSIEENIRYGKPSATDEEVRDAARLANADEFISRFPAGYNTIVGERGTQLSGGQKQRVAIARALLKNPPILILDEATSALDTESERLVRDALDEAMRGRTVLVIAHRLSTIQKANLICVVKDKRVVEQGSHSELMKKRGGLYRALVDSQLLDSE